MRPRSWHTCGLLIGLALAGCSRDEPSAPAPASAHAVVPLGDEFTLILPDLMDLIVDPAAAVLLTAAAQHARTDLETRSDEAWQAVGDAASQLAQTGDTLAGPALARGRPDWLQWAAAMREGAAAAGAAARRHDPRSLFAAGVQVRASCRACHARYAPGNTTPTASAAART
jgi:hypothetical protein